MDIDRIDGMTVQTGGNPSSVGIGFLPPALPVLCFVGRRME